MSGVEQTYLFVHDARLKTWFPFIFLVKPCELIHQLAPHHLQGTPFSSHQREQCGWVLWEGWQEMARSHVDPLRLWAYCSPEQIHSVGWNMLEHRSDAQNWGLLSFLESVRWIGICFSFDFTSGTFGVARPYIKAVPVCSQIRKSMMKHSQELHHNELFLEEAKKTSWQILLFGMISETNIMQLLQGNGIPVPDDVATAKLRRASKIFPNLFGSFDDLNFTDCISRCPEYIWLL